MIQSTLTGVPVASCSMDMQRMGKDLALCHSILAAQCIRYFQYCFYLLNRCARGVLGNVTATPSLLYHTGFVMLFLKRKVFKAFRFVCNYRSSSGRSPVSTTPFPWYRFGWSCLLSVIPVYPLYSKLHQDFSQRTPDTIEQAHFSMRWYRSRQGPHQVEEDI